MAAKRDRVCLGMVAGAHGVGGAVRVQSYTASPADITAYGPLTDDSGRRFRLAVIGAARGQLLVRIEGVADRSAADALKGVRLYVDRAALPKPQAEEFYHADLIGLAAELADGAAFGTILAVHDFGAGDVIEIARPDGTRVMLPFTKAVVPLVDLAAGRLVVDPPAEVEAAPAAHAGDGAEAEARPR